MLEVHDFKAFPELSNKQLSEYGSTSPHLQITESFDAFVVRVHDADTITVRIPDRSFDFPIRLNNIDAPELSDGGKEVGDYVRNWLEGEIVRVLINKSNRVGKYGRLIGEIMHNGLNVGDTLVRLGMVRVFGAEEDGKVNLLEKLMRGVVI